MVRIICVVALAVVLSGCATWSVANVENASLVKQTTKTQKKTPNQIKLTTGDISNRPYKVLGDIKVSVNKTTIFNKDPTKKDVNQKLRIEASKMGADAVILVRYGTVGIGLVSWGALDGNGRAIKFTK